MKLKLAAPLTKDSIVDGPGLRTVIWTQGCVHHCEGCHNPATHSLTAGMEVDTASIIAEIEQTKLQRGITLSGGEPFLQAEALIDIAYRAKQIGLDVWSYTGFTWEQLNNHSAANYQFNLELLQYIDVLVDGRFMLHMRQPGLRFRGSANQRIIDVKQSLERNQVIVAEAYV